MNGSGWFTVGQRALGMITVLMFVWSGALGQSSWTGSINSDWQNPRNWHGGVPGEGTNVVIGDRFFRGSHHPVITKSAEIGSLTFRSERSSRLTIGPEGSLTVRGDVKGSWSHNQMHSVVVGSSSMTVGGDYFTARTAKRMITTIISSGELRVEGDLYLVHKNSIIFSGEGKLHVGGNYIRSAAFSGIWSYGKF